MYSQERKKLASGQERFTRETLVPSLFCSTLVTIDGVNCHGFIYFFGQRTQYCGRTPARPNTWWVERWGSARQPTQYPMTSVILVIHQHPWWSTGACMTSLLPFLFSFVRKAANTVPHDIGDPGNTSASLVIDWCMRDLLATLSLFICLQGSQHCTPRHRWSW